MARTPVTRQGSRTPARTSEEFVQRIVLSRIDTESSRFSGPNNPTTRHWPTSAVRKSVATEQRVVYQNRAIHARTTAVVPAQSAQAQSKQPAPSAQAQRTIAKQEIEAAILFMKDKWNRDTNTFTREMESLYQRYHQQLASLKDEYQTKEAGLKRKLEVDVQNAKKKFTGDQPSIEHL